MTNKIKFVFRKAQGLKRALKRHLHSMKLSDLKIGPVKGTGKFGIVHQAKHNEKDYALKVVNKAALLREGLGLKAMTREIANMKLLSGHPHIVALVDSFEDEENYNLVMEYASGGDLFEYYRENKPLSEAIIRPIVKDVLLAIEACHKLDIIHRDIKQENVLYFPETGTWKLTDFGWSIQTTAPCVEMAGTLDFIEPRMVNQQPYDYRADIWSFGVLLYELVLGTTPFYAESFSKTYAKIRACNPRFYSGSPEFIDLVSKILVFKPEDRLSVQEIQRHPWFIITQKPMQLSQEP